MAEDPKDNSMVAKLEARLSKMNGNKRKKELLSICMQIVPSRRRRRRKEGQYKSYVESGPEDPSRFVAYLLDRLESYKTDQRIKNYIEKIESTYDLSGAYERKPRENNS
tara:strand:+ start:198 stop:524 length:327 start_codon:yes stop_codon:yes gene_type:complete